MRALSVLLVVLAAGPAPAGAAETPYPLDGLPRTVPGKGAMRCPPVDLVGYRGEVIRYQKPVRIFRDFRPHLVSFEQVVREVAIEVYGRAPARIVHAGTFNCRRIARYPDLLSEHGLGNAIDVAAFEFGPLAGVAPKDLPRALRGRFRVELGRHWGATEGTAAVHARFLDLLARRLVARPEIFRVLLGPSYPGHKGHFHFDMAPYRLIDIWEAGRAEAGRLSAGRAVGPT
jgi:hypothetical protein